MKLLFSLALTALPLAPAFGVTAMEAMKVLPKNEARKVARIEAREGTPDPERWYLLTHDEQSETGLREYVVVGGEVVASRTLSQFAETVQPEEVIGSEVVRFDSDKAARLAQQYAKVNGVTFDALHYQLRKDGPQAVPIWTLICTNAEGRELGRLVVSATKGTVIAHDGFPVEPPTPPPTPTPTPGPSKPTAAKSTPTPTPKPKKASTPAPPTTPIPVMPAEPVEPPRVAERPGFMDRVRGSIQKVLPGKKSEDR